MCFEIDSFHTYRIKKVSLLNLYYGNAFKLIWIRDGGLLKELSSWIDASSLPLLRTGKLRRDLSMYDKSGICEKNNSADLSIFRLFLFVVLSKKKRR